MSVVANPGVSPAHAPSLPAHVDPSDAATTTAGVEGGEDPGNASSNQVRYEPNPREIAGGIASLATWALTFAIGVVFPSEVYRNALTGKGTVLSNGMILPYLLLFLLTYTVSNAAFLCCISAWLGELGRRSRIDGVAQLGPFLRGDYIAAVMRGFLAYLAILAGFVVLGSGVNAFVAPSVDSYVRLAATVSLAGFLVGFNPALFRRFEQTISDRVVTEQHADGTKTTTAERKVVTKVDEKPEPGIAPAAAIPIGGAIAAGHGTPIASPSGRAGISEPASSQ